MIGEDKEEVTRKDSEKVIDGLICHFWIYSSFSRRPVRAWTLSLGLRVRAEWVVNEWTFQNPNNEWSNKRPAGNLQSCAICPCILAPDVENAYGFLPSSVFLALGNEGGQNHFKGRARPAEGTRGFILLSP